MCKFIFSFDNATELNSCIFSLLHIYETVIKRERNNFKMYLRNQAGYDKKTNCNLLSFTVDLAR